MTFSNFKPTGILIRLFSFLVEMDAKPTHIQLEFIDFVLFDAEGNIV
jgi:hypothetical protein